MRRSVVASLAFISLFLFALLMSGCGDFFVSPGSISQVTVSPTGALLKPADTIGLAATAVKVNGTTTVITSTAAWTPSTGNATATVDATGKVTAGSTTGTAAITATAPNSKVSGTATIFVTATLPTQLSVQGSSVIGVGTSVRFHVTAVLDGTTTDISNAVTWASSNSSATVDQYGNVKGVSACTNILGTNCPTITATATTATASNITGTFEITTIQ